MTYDHWKTTDPNDDTFNDDTPISMGPFGAMLSAPEAGPSDYRYCQLFSAGDLVNSFGLYGVVIADAAPREPVAVTFDGKTVIETTPSCLDLIGRYITDYAREH
jgi:hypothetical protein